MSARIRLAGEEDAAAIAAIYAPEVLETSITFEIEPPSVDEMRRRIADTLRQHPWLACERDGEVRGYAYATTHRTRAAYRWAVDVSVYLHHEARGRGIGRALYTALLEILGQQGYTSAHAGITLPNPASIGLHESMGFAPVGVYRGVGYKLGAWHDVGWWCLALQPSRPTPPAEPVALPSLAHGPTIRGALDRGTHRLR